MPSVPSDPDMTKEDRSARVDLYQGRDYNEDWSEHEERCSGAENIDDTAAEAYERLCRMHRSTRHRQLPWWTVATTPV
jgi:hypothetical protein